MITDISSEKLSWCVNYLVNECQSKGVIVWCRFRRERERLVEALKKQNEKLMYIRELYGGQPKQEREDAVTLFSVIENHEVPYILIAQQHAGSHGLNLIAATEHIFLSNDFSLGIRLQAEDRSHRPGQKNAVTYINVLATGPKGERTIDHVIAKALREKKHLAMMTCAEWRKELE
jgi:SNF2 family DNA or RNA helicase